MSHEQQPGENEQPQEVHRPVFDFEQLDPRHAAVLIHVLTKESENLPDGLLGCVCDDLLVIARNSDKAQRIYAALMRHEPPEHTTNHAADMAPELLRRNMGNPQVKEWILGLWVGMLHSENHEVQSNGIHTVQEAIVTAEWLDEPTKQYMESQLPDWYREQE